MELMIIEAWVDRSDGSSGMSDASGRTGQQGSTNGSGGANGSGPHTVCAPPTPMKRIFAATHAKSFLSLSRLCPPASDSVSREMDVTFCALHQSKGRPRRNEGEQVDILSRKPGVVGARSCRTPN